MRQVDAREIPTTLAPNIRMSRRRSIEKSGDSRMTSLQAARASSNFQLTWNFG